VITPALLAAAAFPDGDLPAIRALVDQYAGLVEARARHLGHPLSVTGEGLLADPALACWLSQICFGPAPGPRPLAPRAAAAGEGDGWAGGLVSVPDELSAPLFPAEPKTPRRRHPPAVARAELDAAMRLLGAVWPEAAAEVALLVRALCDTVAPPGRQTSGSSAACPFVVAIAFEAGAWPGYLADALVHESSHIKLRLISRLAAVVAGDGGAADYRHPWRAEARPLEAVLVACHAFVAVHRFHARCVRVRGDEEARAEHRRLGPEVARALAELRRGEPLLTTVGRNLAQRLSDAYERTCFAGWAERIGA
jgi:HEXXH motif-containing protein